MAKADRIGPDGRPRDFVTLVLLSLGVSRVATARLAGSDLPDLPMIDSLKLRESCAGTALRVFVDRVDEARP
jgi:hypothetical protein